MAYGILLAHRCTESAKEIPTGKGGENRMKKVLIIAVALLTMLAFIGGAVAQEKKEAPASKKAATKAPAKGKVPTFTGTITTYDSAAKVLTVKAKNKEKEFTIADNAKIKGNLKEGKKVVVKYKKEGDKNVATSIAPPAKKGKTTPKKANKA
jgi:hypothetical protein